MKAELPADAFKEAWIRALTKKQEQPAAKKLEKKPSSASEEEDVDSPEARTEAAVDIAACLAANFSKYKFFEIAVRVDHAHLTVPSSIRNKVKKLRENLRKGTFSLYFLTLSIGSAEAQWYNQMLGRWVITLRIILIQFHQLLIILGANYAPLYNAMKLK